MNNEFDIQTRNMILALYVLTGVVTREQMRKLATDTPVPETWEDIVDVIEHLSQK